MLIWFGKDSSLVHIDLDLFPLLLLTIWETHVFVNKVLVLFHYVHNLLKPVLLHFHSALLPTLGMWLVLAAPEEVFPDLWTHQELPSVLWLRLVIISRTHLLSRRSKLDCLILFLPAEVVLSPRTVWVHQVRVHPLWSHPLGFHLLWFRAKLVQWQWRQEEHLLLGICADDIHRIGLVSLAV